MPRAVDVAPPPPSGEGGFTLIELLVAMSLLAIVMSAAVIGINTTLDMTRNDRQRSVAADLAAQEMDTVRNSDFTTLASGTITKSQTVDGAVYTIKRFSSWVSASATTGPCDGPTASVAYLRVTVRVSWNQMQGVQPVRSQTVIAPPVGTYDPNTGGIAVKVLTRDALPSQGASVTITGPSGTSTQVTTEDGCAFFAFVQAGSYTVTLNNSGYVDGQGTVSPSASATVSVGATTAVQFDYDQASTINATLQGVGGSAVPAVAVSLGNSHLIPVGTKAVAGSGASRTVSNLFPYADGYQLWAGDCADADPLGTNTSGVR
ncbi:MAG TPA: prepilin-type N-terminal cleavage/methylation domain-containing protein, partial [Actinomycetota bacterium]